MNAALGVIVVLCALGAAIAALLLRRKVAGLRGVNEALRAQLKQTEQDLKRSGEQLAHSQNKIEEIEKRLSANHRQLEANELELRESELKFKELVELLPQVVFEADQSGIFTFTNQRGFELTGFSQDDIDRGLSVMDTLVPEDRDRAYQSMVDIFKGARLRGNQYTFMRKDGSTFPGVIYSSPIMAEGKPAGLRGIVVDITEQRHREEERQRAQKLESIGTLAGGIAHDFNNLLGAIFGNLDLACQGAANASAQKAYLEEALAAHQRASDLTQQLLTFAKGGQPVKRSVSIQKVIKDAVSLALSGSNVRCETNVADDLWSCFADESQIHQVASNLLINAQQAMPEGGRILVHARNVVVDGSESLPVKNGKYVRIDFVDQGEGIEPEIINRIFDPFFSTKQNGSGLGLATSYSIVKKHDGHIQAHSEPGRQTVVSVWLPATPRRVRAQNPAEVHEHKGRGAILVLDDELSIRKMSKAMLAQLGYQPETAASASDALAAYRRRLESGEPFVAVILDLTIPGGKGGQAVLDQMRSLDANVKAIVSSGYSDDPVMANPKGYGFAGVIKKPYLMRDLAAALEAVLGDTNASNA